MSGHVVVACASHPLRGVLLAVDDNAIVVTPDVARVIAKQLIESADRIEETGGASKELDAHSREPLETEVPGILRRLGLEPPDEPS